MWEVFPDGLSPATVRRVEACHFAGPNMTLDSVDPEDNHRFRGFLRLGQEDLRLGQGCPCPDLLCHRYLRERR